MLEWAVTSSVLILAVLLLRQCLKGRSACGSSTACGPWCSCGC